MGDIKVRNLSEVMKVEIDSGQCSKNWFVPFQTNHDVAKEEFCQEYNVEEKVKFKDDPLDDFDMNDTDTNDELVMQLLKRTIKVDRCTCEKCGEVCNSMEDLHLHKQECLSRTPIHQFNCFRCSETFATYRQRQHHMFVHRDLSPLVCRYCNKRSLNLKQANWHASFKHISSGRKPKFVCRFCFAFFYQATPYERHLRVHDESYKCTICFQRFCLRNQFEDHLVEMHATGMKTKEENFNELSDQETVKSEPTSELNIDDKDFIKSEISMKVVPAKVEGPFRCDRCAESFRYSTQFLQHMKRHIVRLREFNCLHCRLFNFKTKRALKRHLKRFHPNASSQEESVNTESIKTEGGDEAEVDRKPEIPEAMVSNPTTDVTTNPLQFREHFIVDEVGHVEMSHFSELIKRFVN
ncbi:Zinc finger protein [Pseudolycoriella hygida]|uniref:Zinc finger protein n=1 Tax=Pseudolycoriella hygida TaxID=35572 RepID=A0A9Q0RZG2_9DIPT|nr:Zinc finger protein [Pseudolycoriella hygida]